MIKGIFDLLLKFASTDLKLFIKIAKSLNGTPQQLLKVLTTNPEKIGELLGKLDPKKRKIIGEDIANATAQQSEFSFLSSSWLSSGQFEPISTGVAGNLTLTTKKGNSYTWPNVPYSVWTAMKKATGQNGSGAGSVFWALYLRSAKGSKFQAKISAVFKLAGVSNPIKDPNAMFKKSVPQAQKILKSLSKAQKSNIIKANKPRKAKVK